MTKPCKPSCKPGHPWLCSDCDVHTQPKYPAWVCAKCGDKYGRKKPGVATWHYDDCGVCGKHTIVTEPRDFGHLKDGWENEKEKNT